MLPGTLTPVPRRLPNGAKTHLLCCADDAKPCLAHFSLMVAVCAFVLVCACVVCAGGLDSLVCVATQTHPSSRWPGVRVEGCLFRVCVCVCCAAAVQAAAPTPQQYFAILQARMAAGAKELHDCGHHHDVTVAAAAAVMGPGLPTPLPRHAASVEGAPSAASATAAPPPAAGLEPPGLPLPPTVGPTGAAPAPAVASAADPGPELSLAPTPTGGHAPVSVSAVSAGSASEPAAPAPVVDSEAAVAAVKAFRRLQEERVGVFADFEE
jgi:hypothetical protein